MSDLSPIIDDLSRPAPQASNGADWQFIADGVMGGVSQGAMARETVEGRERLPHARPGELGQQWRLHPDGVGFGAGWLTRWTRAPSPALNSDCSWQRRDLQSASAHTDVTRPWQSYRQSFIAGPDWETHRIPFSDFAPHRIDVPLNVTKLRRIGILAIGREFQADVSVGGVRFFLLNKSLRRHPRAWGGIH
jgi:hypothetical protein